MNLIDGGKLTCWTVTWIDNAGSMVMMEPDNKEEVFELLEDLKSGGQDMSYVSVFPPKTNLTYKELVDYLE